MWFSKGIFHDRSQRNARNIGRPPGRHRVGTKCFRRPHRSPRQNHHSHCSRQLLPGCGRWWRRGLRVGEDKRRRWWRGNGQGQTGGRLGDYRIRHALRRPLRSATGRRVHSGRDSDRPAAAPRLPLEVRHRFASGNLLSSVGYLPRVILSEPSLYSGGHPERARPPLADESKHPYCSDEAGLCRSGNLH